MRKIRRGKAYELPSSDSRLNPVAVPAHHTFKGVQVQVLHNGSDSQRIVGHRTNLTAKFCAFGDAQPERTHSLANPKRVPEGAIPSACFILRSEAACKDAQTCAMEIAGLKRPTDGAELEGKDLARVEMRWVRGSFAFAPSL